MAPRRPKTATRRPKTRQDGPKMAPRCAQDGTRTVKRAMLKQVGFRMASERENIEKPGKKRVFGVPFGGFWEAKAAIRRFKTATRRPKT